MEMGSGCVLGRDGRLRWDRSGRWVPHSTSSGQALRGRRDVVRLGPPKTAGRLTMNGRGWGTEVGRRGLGAAWDVFSRSGECVQFWGGCVQFRGGCVHFGGRCVQFLAGRPGWGWGADGRRDSSAPLRCARNDNSGGGGALGMRAWTGCGSTGSPGTLGALGLIMALGPG